MAQLIVTLSLLVGGANAMGIYGTGRPTAEPTGAPTAVCPPCTVRIIKPAGTTFANSDNTCYVVDGTFPSGIIVISDPGARPASITPARTNAKELERRLWVEARRSPSPLSATASR